MSIEDETPLGEWERIPEPGERVQFGVADVPPAVIVRVRKGFVVYVYVDERDHERCWPLADWAAMEARRLPPGEGL